MKRARALLLGALALLGWSAPLCAQILPGPEPPKFDWQPSLGATLPLDARFVDHEGRELALRDCLGERPVVLALVYYRCPMLCGLVLEGMVQSLRAVDFTTGTDFDVLVLSIDPSETPELAAAKRLSTLEGYGLHVGDKPAGAWRFLVGSEEAVRSVADAVGFGYERMPGSGDYAHGAGLTVLTPAGQVSRVLFGVEFAPRDLRLALVEASAGTIGTPIDQVLLRCFHYDPTRGKYGFEVLFVVRALGALTLALLAFFVVGWLRRERRARLALERGS
ncbi:MAG: SCO family protein [Planctomycetes bacterium]|nr:SCO family protein [Planctomycetota bacterium]